MITTGQNRSLFDLIGALHEDTKTFIKQEFQLAKTELGEKFSCMGRNSIYLAAGAFVALFSLVFLLLGLNFVLVLLYQKAGLSAGVANFVAPFSVAVLFGAVGFSLIEKGLGAFKDASIAPEKAIEALKGPETEQLDWKKDYKKEAAEIKAEAKAEDKQTSEELKTDVDQTKNRMERRVIQIKDRLTPSSMARRVKTKIQRNPARTAIIGVGTGVAGYLLVRMRAKSHRCAVAVKA